MNRFEQSDLSATGEGTPVRLVPDLELLQMMVPLPFQATEQQMELYATRREWLTGTNPLKKPARTRFVSTVKNNLKEHPDEVTTVYVTGESVGTGKENECAQWVAELLFDTSFRSELMGMTGKDVMPHYLSFGMGIREARAAGLIVSDHPDYMPFEISHGRDYLLSITQRARRVLPVLYPDHVHSLIVEVPATFAVPGRLIMPDSKYPPPESLDITPNTFMRIRMTVPQAQNEALQTREHYRPDDAGGVTAVRQDHVNKQILVDNPDFHPEMVAWNCGDGNAAQKSRDTMDTLMASASRQGLLPNAGAFTERDLQSDPELRNGKALRDFYEYLATRQWRVLDSLAGNRRIKNWMIDDPEYLTGEKHFFQRLLYAHMLNTDQIRDLHVNLFG